MARGVGFGIGIGIMQAPLLSLGCVRVGEGGRIVMGRGIGIESGSGIG